MLSNAGIAKQHQQSTRSQGSGFNWRTRFICTQMGGGRLPSCQMKGAGRRVLRGRGYWSTWYETVSEDVPSLCFLISINGEVLRSGFDKKLGCCSKVIFMSAWRTAELPPWSCWWGVDGMEEGPLTRFSPGYGGQVLSLLHPTQCGRKGRPAFLSPCRVEQIRLNATNTFLVYTEEDLGDLLKIKVTWERESQSWYNLWKELRNYLYPTRKSEQELNIRRIRMKSGETQRK